MTVPYALAKVQYDGNGVATSFPFAFKVFEDEDLEVIVTDANGSADVLTLDVDYSVAGAGDDSGGTVTYPISGTALASTERITIRRSIEATQETDLTNQGAFYADVIENALDRVTMLAQQVEEALSRAPKYAEDSETSDAELPEPEAGSVIGYDASGDLANLSLGTGSSWDGLADLALSTSGKGSDLIGVVGPDSALTVTDALAGPWVDLRRYGAATTNTGAENTTAFNAAKAALEALGGGVIFIPAGTWDFESITLTSGDPISIVGAGSCPWIYEGWSGAKGDNAATIIRHDSGDTGILLELVGGTWPRGRIALRSLNLIGNANTTTVLRAEGIQRSFVVDDVFVGVHQLAEATNEYDALGVDLYCCWYVQFNQVEIYQWTHTDTGNGTPIDNIALSGDGATATVTATGDIHADERDPVVGDMVQIRGMATLGLNDYWTITSFTKAADQLTFAVTEHVDAWAITTYYTVHDLASNGGNVYRCKLSHLSGGGAFPGVGTYWEILATEDPAPSGARLRWRTGHGIGLKIWNHPGDTYNGAFNMSVFTQCFISNFERCLQLGETNDSGRYSRYVNGIAFVGGAIQGGLDYGIFLGSGVESASFTGVHVEQSNRGLNARYGTRNTTFRNGKMHDNNIHIDLWQDGTAPRKGAPNFLAEQVLLTGTMRGIRVQGGSGTPVMRFRQINMVPAEDGEGIGFEVRGSYQCQDLVLDGMIFNDDNAAAGPTEFVHRIVDQLGSIRIANHRKYAVRALTSDLTLTTNHSGMLFTNEGASATVTFTLADPADRLDDLELPLEYEFFQANGSYAVRIAPPSGVSILEAVDLAPTPTDATSDPVSQSDMNNNILPSLGAVSDAITGTGSNYMEAGASSGMKAYCKLKALDDTTYLVLQQWGNWVEGP